MESNFTIGSGAELALWAPGAIFVSPPGGNRSLSLLVEGKLWIDGSTGLTVNASAPVQLRLVVLGTLEVTEGAEASLTNTTLVLGPQAQVILLGGSLLTPAPDLVDGDGGSVAISAGGSWYGGPSLPPSAVPPVGATHLDVAGDLGFLNLSGVPLEDANVSATIINVQGFEAAPTAISEVNVGTARSFRADDADLTDVALTSAANVTLGAPEATADLVNVDRLTVARGLGNLTVAHAQVTGLNISSAAHVLVENSSFSDSPTVAQATSNFTAFEGSHFGFPLVFNDAPRVNLTNVSGPGLEVVGLANVSVYNWPYPTSYSGGTSATIPGITVFPQQVEVRVWRFLLVSVVAQGRTQPPAGTSVTVCSQEVAASCSSSPVNAQGSFGLFVLTDKVSLLGVDAFVGNYRVAATVPGYGTTSASVAVTADDLDINLTATLAVVPAQLVPLLLLEVGGVGAVIGLMVYLRARIHRVRRPRTLKGSHPVEEPPEDPPAPGPAAAAELPNEK